MGFERENPVKMRLQLVSGKVQFVTVRERGRGPVD
jgi:hypothetical protein